uniref:Uncharacterized protein n=1 Tax=Ditylenchus dipsaci TaxID=166011 RepID=A0A915E2J1_9BILA
MSDWEADDFDPSAQVADRMVTLVWILSETGGELTEKQKLERQKQSDKEIAMDMFGIESEKQKTWEDLKKPADFSDSMEICQPMTKLQLHTVRDTISKYISAIEKKEEEQKSSNP